MSTWKSFIIGTMRRFRLQRAERIRDRFPGIAEMDVLDVGGSIHFWEAVEPVLKPKSVTILNITEDGTAKSGSADGRIILYDGKRIPFGDGEVDLVVCNSVIEHVPPEARALFAEEIRRVAKRYVVQTPAYAFPIEPHFVAPFVHWLPRSLGRIAARVTPRAFASGRPVTEVFDEVHLLRLEEMKALFGADLEIERFAGLPKSYLAFQGAA